MRLRFINTFVPVSPLYRDLLPALARQGHEVEVLLSGRRYRDGALAGGWRDDIRCREVPSLPLPERWRTLDRGLSHASFGLGVAASTLLSPRAACNVFVSQPPVFQVWGRALRRLRGQPYACISMDLWPWVAFEAGVLPRDGAAGRALAAAARSALREADLVIAIGRCMAARLVSEGVSADRVRVIPNWAGGSVRPVDPGANPLRRRLGLQGKFVVMYSGNHGVSHRFEDVLEVARRLKDVRDVAFVFAGDGRRRPEVVSFARRERLANVSCLGLQPQDELAASLSAGDAHFISLRRGFEGLVVPSKAYGVMAAGRPILYQGHPDGEVARVVTEAGIGRVLAEGDVDGLAQAILHARDDATWRAEAGARARALAEGELSARAGVEAYLRALEGLAR
jgi:putative colanic acid biosynthesis glycosyltransferase WcaI